MKIYLYEPTKLLRRTLQNYLQTQKFLVDTFVMFDEANDAIDNGYNCYIIGIDNQSYAQSLDLLKSIRLYYPKVPVLFISFHEHLDVSIIRKAYQYGCDDILKQPFLLEEIDRKVVRLLHICRNIIHFGNYGTFDFNAGHLISDGRKQHFTKSEKQLLSVLYSYQNNVVSFEMIQNIVWAGECVTLDCIRSLVSRLRKKLPFIAIETITNIGYVLKLDSLKASHIASA